MNHLSATPALKWSGVDVYGCDHSQGLCSYYTPGERKQLLFGCCGALPCRTITGLMGLSGSGKSTLLNTLACRQPQGSDTWTGRIEINGIMVTHSHRKCVMYVPQFDVYWLSLTVEQHLTYIAELHLCDTAYDAITANNYTSWCAHIVGNAITEMCLNHCANTLLLHLSGGERKRLSLATELIGTSNPSGDPSMRILLLGKWRVLSINPVLCNIIIDCFHMLIQMNQFPD